MKNILKCNGELVTVNGHKIHIYIDGNEDAPTIVFMSGHCTVAPVYDFKVLYEKLLSSFKVIVIENGACCVGDSRLNVSAFLFGCGNCGL